MTLGAAAYLLARAGVSHDTVVYRLRQKSPTSLRAFVVNNLGYLAMLMVWRFSFPYGPVTFAYRLILRQVEIDCVGVTALFGSHN